MSTCPHWHLPTHCLALPARSALDTYVIRGVQHNAPLLRTVLDAPDFVAGNVSTEFLAKHYPTPEASAPHALPLTPQQVRWGGTGMLGPLHWWGQEGVGPRYHM